MNWIDYIGYAASFFIVLSFLIKNITYIRSINLVGCLLFVIYGYFIGSIPIILPNAFLVFVQVYYLFFDKKTEYKTK